MTRYLHCHLSIFAFLLAAMTVRAGTISLDVSVTVDKHELDVELSIVVANQGDDTAHRVEPFAQVGGVSYLFDPAAIPPGQRQTFRKRQTIPAIADMKPGEYPVSVMVAYRDSEGAQYHAPAYGILRTADTEFSPQVKIQAEPVYLRDRAEVRVTVSVGDSVEEMSVKITPHTSPLVEVAPSSVSVPIDGEQPVTVEFELRNSDGVADASMPLIFFAEAESADGHAIVVNDVPLTLVGDAGANGEVAGHTGSLRWMIGLGVLVLLLAIISSGVVFLHSCSRKSLSSRP